MAEGTASTSSRERSGLLERALVFGSAGAAVGLIVSLRGIWLHGYLELGFLFTVLRSLAVSLGIGAAAGAFVALAVGAIVDNLAATSEQWGRRISGEGWIRFCRDPALRVERWILVAASALLFAIIRRYDENTWATGALVWAAACSGLVALGMALAGRLSGRATGLASVSSLVLLYGWALVFGDSYGRADLAAGDWGDLATALAAAGLVFGVVSVADSGFGARARIWIGLPLVMTLLAWPLHWLTGPTREATNPRSVVLIGIDTLRFDRTGLRPQSGSGDRRLMPGLRAFAESGAVFREATSQAPWTLPSFASVLTGRYPREHGAISLRGLLRPRETTLAEVLREAGYHTGAVVSHVYVDARRGLDQGFDRFDMSNILSEADISGDAVTDTALAWLQATGDGPFFLFVHYFDPHYEYRDHAQWRFADGYRGKLDVREVGIYELRERLPELDAAEVDHLRDLYDEEVAYTDRAIARLLEGIGEDTAVAIVSDHGEELLDRGWLGHTVSLHQEVIHVPLLLRLPDVTQPGQVVDAPVETRALYATLLDYLGLGGGDDSLLPLLDGSARDPRTVFSDVWLPDAPEDSGKRVRRSMVRRGSWKLIRDHDRGLDVLYDLARDPGETRNLAVESAESAEMLERLRAALDAWIARMLDADGRIPVRALGDEERKRLEALGYL